MTARPWLLDLPRRHLRTGTHKHGWAGGAQCIPGGGARTGDPGTQPGVLPLLTQRRLVGGCRAGSIVTGHRHPSGVLRPSPHQQPPARHQRRLRPASADGRPRTCAAPHRPPPRRSPIGRSSSSPPFAPYSSPSRPSRWRSRRYGCCNDPPKSWLGVLTVIKAFMATTMQVAATRGAHTIDGAARALRQAGLAAAVGCPIYLIAGETAGVLTMIVFVLATILLTMSEMWQSAGAWTLAAELPPPDRAASTSASSEWVAPRRA